MRSLLLGAALALSATTAQAFKPLECRSVLRSIDTTWRIEKGTLYQHEGGKVTAAKLKDHRRQGRADSWTVIEGEGSEGTHLYVTNRRDFLWAFGAAAGMRGICGDKLPALPRPVGTATFKPVVCSATGDWEWVVDGKRMTTELKAETAYGILKDERDLNRGKRWLVQFSGGQAFLTITEDGNYTVLHETGMKTEGKCVPFEERYPKQQ
jgi:hypothetical protein